MLNLKLIYNTFISIHHNMCCEGLTEKIFLAAHTAFLDLDEVQH